jgi:hypothetical protein
VQKQEFDETFDEVITDVLVRRGFAQRGKSLFLSEEIDSWHGSGVPGASRSPAALRTWSAFDIPSCATRTSWCPRQRQAMREITRGC